MTLRWGQPAPDFELPSTTGGPISLQQYRGRADVVLGFYCYDFGGIWTPELTGLGQAAGELTKRGAALLAVSGDSPFCHAAFVEAHPLPFPLLSDVHRTVIAAYGVLDADRNVAYRSTFVIDREGLLRWGQAGDRQMVRDGSELLRVVDLVASLRPPS
jgi:peroxiredoxin